MASASVVTVSTQQASAHPDGGDAEDSKKVVLIPNRLILKTATYNRLVSIHQQTDWGYKEAEFVIPMLPAQRPSPGQLLP